MKNRVNILGYITKVENRWSIINPKYNNIIRTIF